MNQAFLIAVMMAAACTTEPTTKQNHQDSDVVDAQQLEQMSRADPSIIDVSKMSPDAIRTFKVTQPEVSCTQTFCTPYSCVPTGTGIDCVHDTASDLQCSFADCDDGLDSWCGDDDRFEASDTLRCDSTCDFELPNNPDGYADCVSSCMNQTRRHCTASNVLKSGGQ